MPKISQYFDGLPKISQFKTSKMPKISQYSFCFPNPVRLEESPENLLSLVLVFCGEHVLQIVFQVVLRELCHHADVIFSV